MTDKPKGPPKGGKNQVSDQDSIDTLPLSMIPLTSTTLKSARLVKNSRLETQVELMNDPITGSLQIRPEDIAQQFPGSKEDHKIINSLSQLNSYDVYSLRTSLKKLGIEVENSTVLELSESMKDRLDHYAVEFTRPLLRNIFGNGQESDQQSLLKLFRDPDRTLVAQRLKTLAEKTGMPVEDLPKFLEGYNDIFLSVAYYRHSFESAVPDINRFWLWLGDLKSKREVATSPRTMASCKRVEESLRFLSTSIRERLGSFKNSFEVFWDDMNRDSFEKLRKEIEDNHVGMGGVLCGLVVKMRLWSQEFPDNAIGGPATRAGFLLSEMEPGLEHLKEMENEARQRIGLGSVHVF